MPYQTNHWVCECGYDLSNIIAKCLKSIRKLTKRLRFVKQFTITYECPECKKTAPIEVKKVGEILNGKELRLI